MKFHTFVNEKKGTVAVKGEDPLEEYYTEFKNFYHKLGMEPDFSLFEEFMDSFGVQIKKMVGISTCNFSEGDVFFVEFGKNLAYERYMKAFETFRIHMYDKIEEKLSRAAEFAEHRAHNCRLRRIDREDEIIHMTK